MAEKKELQLSSYDYYLPTNLIAQRPLRKRDHSRLMIIYRDTGAKEHRFFYELPSILQPGDMLVLNDTKVIPARLYGTRKDTGGKAEILLLEKTREDREEWKCMIKPGKHNRPGISFLLAESVEAEVKKQVGEGYGNVEFHTANNFKEWLHRAGNMPLPPYIKEGVEHREEYQTVYSSQEGSVAAPTAGFHFTPHLLNKLKEQAIQTVYLTLHVGPGTFLPVKTEDIRNHQMHREYFFLPPSSAEKINQAKSEGRRVIAVGTTSCRVLETMAIDRGKVDSGKSWTELFIYPGYQFKIINGLLTNFHLPRSTLLMLVSAFAGRQLILEAYQEAVEQGYRFYSFGDATLIL